MSGCRIGRWDESIAFWPRPNSGAPPTPFLFSLFVGITVHVPFMQFALDCIYILREPIPLDGRTYVHKIHTHSQEKEEPNHVVGCPDSQGSCRRGTSRFSATLSFSSPSSCVVTEAVAFFCWLAVRWVRWTKGVQKYGCGQGSRPARKQASTPRSRQGHRNGQRPDQSLHSYVS